MGELQLNLLILVVTGQCPQGRETTDTSWVGARVSEKALKTVGLWVDLAVIQSLGKTMAHVSFLAEAPLGSCRVKEAGSLSPSSGQT